MTLKTDLEAEVSQIYTGVWDETRTGNVPDPEDVRLNNHAKNLESATVLYADLDGSTNMVDNYQWWFSAEIYQTYLRCAARVIASNDGVVTAYDGDRVMAVFTGNSKNTNAVRSALQIHWAVHYILRPAIKARYKDTTFVLDHVVGVDTSQLRAARIGVRGYNDLVWIGRAANHAAKLTSLSEKPLWITKAVYDEMHATVKYSNGTDIWTKRSWTSMQNAEIYCSTYATAIA
ncbi:class 3 adenylate cyclase [Variovorax paradoxus]|uniref:adenylate/guanylate cyclase domain-containing protein n=1 Tax=Variovorax paradoxus TaxID=34073 RepID=UPI003399EF4D